MRPKADPTAHFVGFLLVLAMLSCAAALTSPTDVDAEGLGLDGMVAFATP
jgi:hypothetical protein